METLSEQVAAQFKSAATKLADSRVLNGKNESTAWEGYLGASVQHIAQSRSIFMDDAKQLITLVLAIFIGAAVLGSFASNEELSERESIVLWIAAITIVTFIFPIATAVEAKARAAYDLYVAAAIHAALLHEAVGHGESHEWFAHVHRNIAEIEDDDKCGIRDFDVAKHWKRVLIERWMKSSSAANYRWNLLKPRSGNLLHSFNHLTRWSRIGAIAAMLLGLVFAVFHIGDTYHSKDETSNSKANTSIVEPIGVKTESDSTDGKPDAGTAISPDLPANSNLTDRANSAPLKNSNPSSKNQN